MLQNIMILLIRIMFIVFGRYLLFHRTFYQKKMGTKKVGTLVQMQHRTKEKLTLLSICLFMKEFFV